MTAVLSRELALTVDPGEFKAAIAAAAKRVPSRPALPILGCIRLEAGNGTLVVGAYDQDVAFTATLSADTAGDGIALVSGRLLGTLVDTLPAKPVHLHVEGDRLNLECGTVKLGFPLLPAGDYPALPQLPDAIGIVNAADLTSAVRRVTSATQQDATPPFLVGLWFRPGDELAMAASDGYRAAVAEVPWARTDTDAGEFFVPAHTFDALIGLLPAAGEVTLHVGDHLVGLSAAGRSFTLARMGGDYPGERALSLFEFEAQYRVVLDGSEFADHVSRANRVHEKQSPITLAFTADEVSITATGADTTEAAAVMPCHLEGKPLTVKVNPDYLANALRQVGAGEVALEFAGEFKAFRVLPTTGTGYRHLVMPIRK